ncbi:MAG: hypothetical protein J5867_09185, partial [Prevotella sp.]|nr:hypothetical protein [Prevotella sp.]
MSKRLLILLTILTTLSITASAQHTEQMLAIHHDNGKTTYIAAEMLDSITYSTYDLDNQPCEGKVTVELHLPDTLVRMALAGIDSLCV